MKRNIFAALFCLIAVLLSVAPMAQAAVTVTGTVPAGGKYQVSAAQIGITTHAVLKITFQNLTSGTNLSFCAGSGSQFNAKQCGTLLGASGGPGYTTLTIIDAASLNGMTLYVIREAGSANSNFTITIE
jgi:hypothetical protein